MTQTRTLTTYSTATGSIPVAPTDAVATISNVTYESNFNLTRMREAWQKTQADATTEQPGTP